MKIDHNKIPQKRSKGFAHNLAPRFITIGALIWAVLGTTSALALSSGDNSTEDFDFQKNNAPSLDGNSKEPVFLDVEDAFKLDIDSNSRSLIWTIAPNYYLYKRKFKILQTSHQSNAVAQDITPEARFSKGLKKNDAYFGKVEVFYNQALATLPANLTSQSNPIQSITVEYQGCADSGLCYPVQTKTITLP